MICRSAVKPIFVGLGTAAILAAGGASAIAGTQTPSPSPSGSASEPGTIPAEPTLKVTVTASDSSAKAGEEIEIKTRVSTDTGEATGVKVTAVEVTTTPKTNPVITGACPPPATAASCTLGTVGTEGKPITSVVTVPEKISKTVTVTYKVTVAGSTAKDKVQTVDDRASVTYTPIKATSPPPTKTPTKSPTKKPSPSPSSSASSGGGSGSGGSAGGSSSGSGTGVVAPSPNSSFNPRNPQLALPPITTAPNPSVAPGQGSSTPQSRLQGNKEPVAQDLTFERMASMQIAWLAALMVAFSLLLTQVRLGRRRMAAGAAPKRVRGTHRRPRKGMFGK